MCDELPPELSPTNGDKKGGPVSNYAPSTTPTSALTSDAAQSHDPAHSLRAELAAFLAFLRGAKVTPQTATHVI